MSNTMISYGFIGEQLRPPTLPEVRTNFGPGTWLDEHPAGPSRLALLDGAGELDEL